MTIAMGFQCFDGVVLCADTEMSHGRSGKSQESKIHILSNGTSGYGCACVYSGDVDFFKRTIPSLERAVRNQKGKLVGRLEREWLAIHKKSMVRFKREEEFPFVQMLFAVGTGSGPRLYSAYLDNFRPEKKYGIIGVGDNVARSFIEPYYPSSQELPSCDEMTFLAMGGLYLAKNFVQGCGKKSQFLVFDDVSDQAGLEVLGATEKERIEKDFLYLQEQLGILVLGFSRIGCVTFDDALRQFMGKIKAYHKKRGRILEQEEAEASRQVEREIWKQGGY